MTGTAVTIGTQQPLAKGGRTAGKSRIVLNNFTFAKSH
jgi:hypothetical protein